MSKSVENTEEESFIILGTSPTGTSLEYPYNGVHPNQSTAPDLSKVSEVLDGLSVEANMAFKAHFNIGDNPSPSSMMIASSIVSEDRSTVELQKKFGEMLDENLILKETLKHNNDSMKEQFLLIASCQEDMLNTHKIHKEKFDETKELIERLRVENKKLKKDILKYSEIPKSLSPPPSVTNGDVLGSGAAGEVQMVSAVYEFVTSPDEDTINKLTAQLELVERQRRQVIVENEKLTWQKESLEHIVDLTSKERDDLKDKINVIELEHSKRESDLLTENRILKKNAQDLQSNLENTKSLGNVNSIEIKERDKAIQTLEGKVSQLQNELKNSQLKILELENIKLEFSRQKYGQADTVKMYKEQIQSLELWLKEAQTTVFQPVRFSISSETELASSEYSSYVSNIKLYDKTLKHLSELLNTITHGTSESLSKSLELSAQLCELKLDRCTADKVRASLVEMKNSLESQHSAALNNIGQIRGTVSIFEGIFNEHKEILKKGLTKNETGNKQPLRASENIDALTAALVARGQELQVSDQEVGRLRAVLTTLQSESDERELLRAQIMVYKSDFEAEREARQKQAGDMETVLADLRTTQGRNQDLMEQLEEVRKLNPNIFKSATTKRTRPVPTRTAPTPTTGNMVYTCPKCNAFSCDQYKVIEDHVNMCLDM